MIDFLKRLPFLKGWFENDLKTLSYHFDCQQFNRNQVIYRQGMEVVHVAPS